MIRSSGSVLPCGCPPHCDQASDAPLAHFLPAHGSVSGKARICTPHAVTAHAVPERPAQTEADGHRPPPVRTSAWRPGQEQGQALRKARRSAPGLRSPSPAHTGAATNIAMLRRVEPGVPGDDPASERAGGATDTGHSTAGLPRGPGGGRDRRSVREDDRDWGRARIGTSGHGDCSRLEPLVQACADARTC